jgi:hypothetical protein
MLALRFDEKHEANIMEILEYRIEGASVGQKKRERERMEMEKVFCVVL